MYEVSQKQHFIFRSNKLLENIGASHIIREITSDPLKLFENELVKQYVHDTTALPEPSYRIVGGGNATFIFDDEEKRSDFIDSELLNISERIEKQFGQNVMIFNTFLNPKKTRM